MGSTSKRGAVHREPQEEGSEVLRHGTRAVHHQGSERTRLESCSMSKLQRFYDAGFDRTTHKPFSKEYKIGCSACSALVINGVACHETGCPNAMHECAGCNERISMQQRYCADCI